MTFFGLNTALRGILAQQAALDVTGHNIANVNTEGYSRQRADLQTTTPHTLPGQNMAIPGQKGTGVKVAGYERLRDQFVDMNIRQQMANQFGASVTHSSLRQVEAAFGEPGENSISALMQRFYGALEDVAANPSNMAARQALAQMGDALARGMNGLDAQLQQIASVSDQRLDDQVQQVNSITARIAQLNATIRDSLAVGQNPNDLLDERDRLLDQLSTKFNLSYTITGPYSQATVTFGTMLPINIVDPAMPGGTTPITRADLDLAYANGDLTSGEVFADQDLLQSIIPGYVQRLDDLVASMVTELNAMNTAGFDLDGNSGLDLFDPAGLTAGTMRFSPAVLANPRTIGAADSWTLPGEPGNGNNANAMLALRSAVQGPPLNATWGDHYRSTITDLGKRTEQAQRDVGNTTAVVDSLQRRRAETAGVSLDEEMSNMLRFQHAYNASARALTAFDEALDVLINRTGRVGL